MHFRINATSEATLFREDGGLSLIISIYGVAIKHCLIPYVKDCRYSKITDYNKKIREHRQAEGLQRVDSGRTSIRNTEASPNKAIRRASTLRPIPSCYL